MGDTIKAMTEAAQGRVISPSDSEYGNARVVHNAMHNRKPHRRRQCIGKQIHR